MFLAVAYSLSCYVPEVSRTARAVIVPQYSTTYANCSADCDGMVGVLSIRSPCLFHSAWPDCRKTDKMAKMRLTCEFKMRFYSEIMLGLLLQRGDRQVRAPRGITDGDGE